jgi:hypothetical protein
LTRVPVDLLRHGRQVRLREVGVVGQERLGATCAALGGDGEARLVERAYLLAAGADVRDGDGTGAPPLPAAWESLGLRNAGAREVGEGAMRALCTFRQAVLAPPEGGG